MDSVDSIESSSRYGSVVPAGLSEDHQMTNTTTMSNNPAADESSGMLSSSKSATLITCSSSFTSECSLTLSNENLRSSPDLCSSKSAPGSRVGRGYRTAGNLLLSVPCERHGGLRRFSMQTGHRFCLSSSDTLFEEQSELILNCGALSSAVLGRIKSFSTSDITMTVDQFEGLNGSSDTNGFGFDSHSHGLKSSLSEIALFGGTVWNAQLNLPNIRSLDATSRSCSTWAMVGDRSISSVSQLPSPSQAHSVSGTLSPTLNPLDIVLSMNKKVRQMYIRQRLLSTYRTLERLSRSHLDLGNLIKGDLINKLIEAQSGAEGATEGPSLSSINKSIDVDSSSVITQLLDSAETKETLSNIPCSDNTFNLSPSTDPLNRQDLSSLLSRSTLAQTNPGAEHNDYEMDPVKTSSDENLDDNNNNTTNITNSKLVGTLSSSSSILLSSTSKFQERLASTPLDLIRLQNDLFSLSVRDIELQKGKPLTKYERNMMIFNWLQNLDQDESN